MCEPRQYCFGIYYYLDNENGTIVYIGKNYSGDSDV